MTTLLNIIPPSSYKRQEIKIVIFPCKREKKSLCKRMTVDEEKKTKTNLTKVLRKYTDFAISIFFITIFTGYMRRKDSTPCNITS